MRWWQRWLLLNGVVGLMFAGFWWPVVGLSGRDLVSMGMGIAAASLCYEWVFLRARERRARLGQEVSYRRL